MQNYRDSFGILLDSNIISFSLNSIESDSKNNNAIRFYILVASFFKGKTFSRYFRNKFNPYFFNFIDAHFFLKINAVL